MNTKTNGSSVTLADIVLSAQAAGQKAFADPSALAQQMTKVEAFKASGFDALDFPTWENGFYAQLEMLTAFSKQSSPATAAATKAAALAEQAALETKQAAAKAPGKPAAS